MTGPTLRSDRLTLVADPDGGGRISSIRLLDGGREVLWRTPWDSRPSSLSDPADPGIEAWLERSGGGWQVMLPNTGDACSVDGVHHPFHGEASCVPWACERDGEDLVLRLSLFSLPLSLERRIRLEDDVVVVSEQVTHTGAEAVLLSWGHHPGFGGDLLAGPARLSCGARNVRSDARVADGPILAGAQGTWPSVPGVDGGPVDLTAPQDGPVLCYASDFPDGAWAALQRLDGSVGVALSWESQDFPYLWIWEELGATTRPPWFGRAQVIGLEPCTSWPGHGLSAIAASTATHLMLSPGEQRHVALRLHVFDGPEPIDGVVNGRACRRSA